MIIAPPIAEPVVMISNSPVSGSTDQDPLVLVE
jgi:hypothetical protein